MNLFDSGSVYNIPFKDDSEGIADTTTDSDTALNLANGKHGYDEPCSPNCSLESDKTFPSSPSCSKERHSSSPSSKDREASTSPTTSAIKTVQSILATLQAGQMSLNQLVALQNSQSPPLMPPCHPWGLPFTGLPGLASLTSSLSPETNPGVQQMYLQQQQHVLQQTLQNMMPSYPSLHNNGQTHTLLLQNQVQQAVDKATRELRILQDAQAQKEEKRFKPSSPTFPTSQEKFEELKAESLSPPRTQISPIMSSSPIASLTSAFNPLTKNSPPLSISIPAHMPPRTPSSISSDYNNTPHLVQNIQNSSPKSSLSNSTSLPCTEITADENITLEELENFAREFKQQRIKLGYTQGDVGLAMGRMYGNDFSQTTISRFEALNLSFNNMCKLKPLLQKWLADADGSSTIQVPNFNCHDLLGKKRKKRTSIENNIRYSLEKAFIQNPKPTSEEVRKISDTLYLDKEVVRVWFCNRRQKEKRVTPESQVSPMSCYSQPRVTSPPLSLFGGSSPMINFSMDHHHRQLKAEAD